MIKKAEICTLPNLCGGKGEAEVHFLLNPEDFYGHARMYAKIILPPGASIGWHQHIGETEPYYILQGQGTFIDNDHQRIDVISGDICTILPGQFHSLENNSENDPLILMALVYYI